jgi:hypothetical protein
VADVPQAVLPEFEKLQKTGIKPRTKHAARRKKRPRRSVPELTERKLDAFINARLVGSLRDIDGVWGFEYSPAWMAASDSFDLSPALPRSTRSHQRFAAICSPTISGYGSFLLKRLVIQDVFQAARPSVRLQYRKSPPQQAVQSNKVYPPPLLRGLCLRLRGGG